MIYEWVPSLLEHHALGIVAMKEQNKYSSLIIADN